MGKIASGWEVVCHEKGHPGPKPNRPDDRKKAEKLGLDHERETGHTFTVMEESLDSPQRPLTGKG